MGLGIPSLGFQAANPLLLKTTARKKFDSENYRIFSRLMGGFKAVSQERASEV